MGLKATHPSRQISKINWDEINKMIAHGKVSINNGQEIPVEICLGGDYKVRYEAVTWRKN